MSRSACDPTAERFENRGGLTCDLNWGFCQFILSLQPHTFGVEHCAEAFDAELVALARQTGGRARRAGRDIEMSERSRSRAY